MRRHAPTAGLGVSRQRAVGIPPYPDILAFPTWGKLLENGTTIGSDARKPEGFVRTSVRPQPKA